MLRAVDAAVALVLDGGMRSESGDFVITRLVATMVDASGFGSGDPAGTFGAATVALADRERLFARAWADRDEPMVRELLFRTLRTAAEENFGLAEDDLLDVAAFRLDPFARRLRLLLRNVGLSGAVVARTIGQPVHQLRHWASGRSKPGADEREALAGALGVHAEWLGEHFDDSADIALYRFRECPCGTGADLRAGVLDKIDGDPASGWGLWCCGCGQPYLLRIDGWLLPVPVSDDGCPCPLVFAAVRDTHENVGGELARPWPHALWVSNPDPYHTGGPYRLPSVLTQPPMYWLRGDQRRQ